MDTITTLWLSAMTVAALLWKRKVEKTMATLSEAIDAVVATAETEKVEVQAALGVLKSEIEALREQIANGVQVTDAQLSTLLNSVNGIYTAE